MANSIYKMSVELVNGNAPNFGIVQLSTGSITSTVQYAYNFEMDNSLTICKLLGYSGWAVNLEPGWLDQWVPGAVKSVESGIPGLIEIRCDYSAESLLDCLPTRPAYGWDISGGNRHSNDKILLCLYNYKIEFVDGLSEKEGRVEIISNNIRLTLRDHGSGGWTDKDARVLCRTAGYEDGTAVSPGTYGEGNQVTMTGSIECSGFETEISDCVLKKQFGSTWTHADDVGVKCAGTYTPLDKPMRSTTKSALSVSTSGSSIPSNTLKSSSMSTVSTVTLSTPRSYRSSEQTTTGISEDRVVTQSPKEGLSTTYIIIAAVSGVLFLLIIISIIVCCCKRTRKPRVSEPGPEPPPRPYTSLTRLPSTDSHHDYITLEGSENQYYTGRDTNQEPLPRTEYFRPSSADFGEIESSGGHISLGPS